MNLIELKEYIKTLHPKIRSQITDKDLKAKSFEQYVNIEELLYQGGQVKISELKKIIYNFNDDDIFVTNIETDYYCDSDYSANLQVYVKSKKSETEEEISKRVLDKVKRIEKKLKIANKKLKV